MNNGDTATWGPGLGPNNPDHQVQIGDKLVTFVTWTSVQFPTTGVSISAFIANNPLSGTGFDITGGFGDVTPGDSTISEFNLRYTIEVLPSFIAQGYRIIDSELAFNGQATGRCLYACGRGRLLDANGVSGSISPPRRLFSHGTGKLIFRTIRIRSSGVHQARSGGCAVLLLRAEQPTSNT